MKRSNLFAIGILLFGSLAQAQDWKNKYDSVSANSSEGIFIIYKKNKAGFADEKTGKEIVPPKYDRVSPYSEGVAVVSKQATYNGFINGLINKTGKEFVPLIYDYISPMEDGIAIVGLKEKYGYIDKTGKKLTPVKYEVAALFSGGMARVSVYDRSKGESKWGFVDKAGKEITALKYDKVLASKEGSAIVEKGENKYFTVNKTGKETPLNYEKIGFAAFDRLLVERNKKFGFINSKGEVDIPLIYDNAYDFSEWQRTGYLTNVRLENKSGCIDTSGKEVIPIKYDWVGLFRDGLAVVTMKMVPAVDSKRGYIDSTDKLVIPMIYNGADNFSEGLAAVSKQSGGRNFTYGYINKEGKEITPFIYESAEEFSGGLAAVKKNGKYGFINNEGKEIIAFKYDRVYKSFRKGGSKWDTAEVELNGKSIRVDKTGKEL